MVLIKGYTIISSNYFRVKLVVFLKKIGYYGTSIFTTMDLRDLRGSEIE